MSENFLNSEQLDLFQYTSKNSSEKILTWEDIYNIKKVEEEINVVKFYPPPDDPYGDLGYKPRKRRWE